ncbi:MAG: cysteine hydrolase, partial [Alicyclobacillus sp.]|nr:cysteine hydrolase [Alicyclobacillus sp.]
MNQEQLDPRHTCLLLFDMLNGHIKKGDSATWERYQPVVENARQLLAAARAAGVMVAYAAANHRPDNGTTVPTLRDTDNRLRPVDPRTVSFEPLVKGGTWESQVIEELAPQPQDYMIPKYRWSAFYKTYLDIA